MTLSTYIGSVPPSISIDNMDGSNGRANPICHCHCHCHLHSAVRDFFESNEKQQEYEQVQESVRDLVPQYFEFNLKWIEWLCCNYYIMLCWNTIQHASYTQVVTITSCNISDYQSISMSTATGPAATVLPSVPVGRSILQNIYIINIINKNWNNSTLLTMSIITM